MQHECHAAGCPEPQQKPIALTFAKEVLPKSVALYYIFEATKPDSPEAPKPHLTGRNGITRQPFLSRTATSGVLEADPILTTRASTISWLLRLDCRSLEGP